MSLSILIPVYGQHDLAREAVRSASKYLDVVNEIRIIDDKPSDPLIDHHPDVLKISAQIKYQINSVNLGRTGTYNKLLQACESNLFLMLDGDDYLADQIDFDSVIQLFEQDPELNIVCGRCCEIFGEEAFKMARPAMRGLAPGLEYFKAWIGVQNLFPHSACIVKKAAAMRYLGYPPDILNSDIVMLRSVLLEGNALVIDELISYWRFHGENASKIADSSVILANFDSVLIPYKRGLDNDLPLKGWLFSNTRMYLLSTFHQILGAGEGRGLWQYLVFLGRMMCMFGSKNGVVLLGIFAALPKLAALVFLRQMLGHKKFALRMAIRGNYVYIAKGLG